jgi:hypothetical protein
MGAASHSFDCSQSVSGPDVNIAESTRMTQSGHLGHRMRRAAEVDIGRAIGAKSDRRPQSERGVSTPSARSIKLFGKLYFFVVRFRSYGVRKLMANTLAARRLSRVCGAWVAVVAALVARTSVLLILGSGP